MQLHRDGTLVVSATDLVGFLGCDHLTTLEVGAAGGLWERPHERQDPEVVLLQERGEAHERAYLDRLRADGRSVVEIARPEVRRPDGYRAAEAATLEAMRDGVGAIYQATLFDGRWLGYADFLLRVERPSPELGGWSYEVADTKLARSVKGSAILQVCAYSDRLATLQGIAPERVHVVTGDGASHPLRLDDYAAYFRSVRARFEGAVFGAADAGPRDPVSAGTYPDPVEHCRVCAWFPVCMDRRRTDDHLSLVAGMSRAATERLVQAAIPTLAALATAPLARPIPDLNDRTRIRLREQARLQLAGREQGELLYELIAPVPTEPGRGLATLPAPSPLDLFFDIEADPWVLDDGLEYLLGVVELDDGEPVYRPIWGHDRHGEKLAFERFIDLVVGRLDADPSMHVYHYGGYESGAVKRLMQRHATREDEVDRLLRGGTFVDLLTAVRQGVRASVESYSLKSIEHFYLAAREGPVTAAGFSVVEYERWLRDRDQGHLTALAEYNRDDCVSTWRLRDWLEDRRAEAIARGWDLPRPDPRPDGPSESLTARLEAVRTRAAALRAGVPDDPAARTPEQAARWLLAALLEYHRREDKPAWWRWFELRDHKSLDELVEAPDAIGGLEYVGDVAADRRSVIRRYRFPPQDHRFRPGDEPVDPGGLGLSPAGAGRIVALDDAGGTVDLRRGPARLDRHPLALIPAQPIPTGVLADALLRLADDVLAHGIDAPGGSRGARDLLLRVPPRRPGSSGRLRRPGEDPVDSARRLAVELRDGVLPIQGPPGTGKTHTGARMILALLDAGRRPIGVTAQSHKTISNLLEQLVAAATAVGRPVRIVQKRDGGEGPIPAGIEIVSSNEAVSGALASGAVDVVAGTAWLFARPEFAGALESLVVDEAGQLALANVLAMSGASRSIILLGDPNQLPQVTQGSHPDGSAVSALEHVLAGRPTLPEDLGLFLDATWRMHPDVNAYISETFYEGRLTTRPRTAGQHVSGTPPLGGTGIRWWPVVHSGNAQRSREEAGVVADAVHRLLDATWTDADGRETWLSIDDLLVVAPYNAHVAAIQAAIEARLGDVRHDRVGTVDKFQGREGAVAIYSMASSSAEDAPRGMDFLYDVHRLNVAVSRARALAVVVASPELLRVACRTPEQMRLANAFCRLVEVAEDGTAG